MPRGRSVALDRDESSVDGQHCYYLLLLYMRTKYMNILIVLVRVQVPLRDAVDLKSRGCCRKLKRVSVRDGSDLWLSMLLLVPVYGSMRKCYYQ